jgi:hypothetical protein
VLTEVILTLKIQLVSAMSVAEVLMLMVIQLKSVAIMLNTPVHNVAMHLVRATVENY